jgi:hypothetical protein
VRLLREAQARSGEAMERVLDELSGLWESDRVREVLARSEERLVGLERATRSGRGSCGRNNQTSGWQERLARELEDLRRQFTQLGSAQSTSEKKIADFGSQLAQANRRRRRKRFTETVYCSPATAPKSSKAMRAR